MPNVLHLIEHDISLTMDVFLQGQQGSDDACQMFFTSFNIYAVDVLKPPKVSAVCG